MEVVKKLTQRKKFDAIAVKLGIKTQSDWYHISKSQLRAHGIKNVSIVTSLKKVYPEFDWESSSFSHVHYPWTQHKNRRKLFDWISEQLNIQKQEDWYSVTRQQIVQLGGESALRRHFKSLHACLSAVYPEFEWCLESFKTTPHSHWQHSNNQRQVFDSIAESLGISTQIDWYNITTDEIRKRRTAQSILVKYYGGSLYSCLSAVYPEFEWDPLKFAYVPLHSWSQLSNHRKLLDQIGEHLQITKQEDWYQVSRKQVHALGGHFVQSHYGTLIDALQSVYPEYEWNALHQTSPLRSVHLPSDTITHTIKELVSEAP
jgi:hypothetical protein